jgi:hypothetical protein
VGVISRRERRTYFGSNRLYAAESLKTTVETVGFGRRMDAAAINWTLLVIDHLNPCFLNFDREER